MLCEHHHKHTKVYIVNQTLEKAQAIAQKFNWQAYSLNDLPQILEEAEVGIVSTACEQPLITGSILPQNRPVTWIDLSVPGNIARGIEKIPGQQVIRVDILNEALEETRQTRQKEVPEAEGILSEVINQYLGRFG
jgi:glutamyl-tRNA reductase